MPEASHVTRKRMLGVILRPRLGSNKIACLRSFYKRLNPLGSLIFTIGIN